MTERTVVVWSVNIRWYVDILNEMINGVKWMKKRDFLFIEIHFVITVYIKQLMICRKGYDITR